MRLQRPPYQNRSLRKTYRSSLRVRDGKALAHFERKRDLLLSRSRVPTTANVDAVWRYARRGRPGISHSKLLSPMTVLQFSLGFPSDHHDSCMAERKRGVNASRVTRNPRTFLRSSPAVTKRIGQGRVPRTVERQTGPPPGHVPPGHVRLRRARSSLDVCLSIRTSASARTWSSMAHRKGILGSIARQRKTYTCARRRFGQQEVEPLKETTTPMPHRGTTRV